MLTFQLIHPILTLVVFTLVPPQEILIVEFEKEVLDTRQSASGLEAM